MLGCQRRETLNEKIEAFLRGQASHRNELMGFQPTLGFWAGPPRQTGLDRNWIGHYMDWQAKASTCPHRTLLGLDNKGISEAIANSTRQFICPGSIPGLSG